MRRPPRLVLDTNVVISAILWGGKPGHLLALAGEDEVRLHTSRVLLDELQATLERPKLARAVEATGLGVGDIVADYRRLTTLTRPTALEKPLSRDPDDDHVIACALAAHADFLVTGDDDLLALGEVEGLAIRSVSASLMELS
jgi:putative PIN family toxin of toxin-antitoxin system